MFELSDLLFAAVACISITLLMIWWSQQTRYWYRIAVGAFLLAFVLCLLGLYLFVVPPYYAGCPAGCAGWRGYPRPVATIGVNGRTQLLPIAFGLNLLMLWLIWLAASLIWRLLAIAFQWWRRPLRTRILFILVVAILPWALLPRLLNPPQPQPLGEDLRLANNARRLAEFTYRVTGPWVLRLALEDVRQSLSNVELRAGTGEEGGYQVCLRGYTYFYIPWRRYRIDLDRSGRTGLALTELPLRESCWQ
ncbi:MAG: hypothetical protein M3Q45_05595 [Chloroflexota bacterium]|nr:hypothetical protein [Chloroflexota bacterium]